jgi:hypothetical protein
MRSITSPTVFSTVYVAVRKNDLPYGNECPIIRPCSLGRGKTVFPVCQVNTVKYCKNTVCIVEVKKKKAFQQS